MNEDQKDNIAALRATTDQANMVWPEVLAPIRCLYDACIGKGFSEDQAWQMTYSYFKILMGMK